MFSNCSPRPRQPSYLGVEFELPSVFDMSQSKGSTPVTTSELDIPDQNPAEYTPVSWPRSMPESMRKPVTLDPYSMGQRAAQRGTGEKSNPFTKKHQPEERADWLDGFLS